MYPSSMHFGLKVVLHIGTLGLKYILFGYMEPLGLGCLGFRASGFRVSGSRGLGDNGFGV